MKLKKFAYFTIIAMVVLSIAILSVNSSRAQDGSAAVSFVQEAEDLGVDTSASSNGPLAAGCVGGDFVPDDGSFENGYGWNAALVSNGYNAEQFTPASYPYTLSQVCVCWVSLGGATLDYDVVIFDDNAGQPGTEIARYGNSITGIPGGLPGAFYDTATNVTINSGSVWIGVNWNPQTFVSRFVCSDENGPGGNNGHGSSDGAATWTPMSALFANYRAMGIRGDGTVVVAPPPVSGINVPNKGEIMITVAMAQPVYDSPGGSIARHRGGQEVWAPHDWDGNGFDTYVITETVEVDGRTWYGIFFGNEQWVYVPADKVIVTR